MGKPGVDSHGASSSTALAEPDVNLGNASGPGLLNRENATTAHGHHHKPAPDLTDIRAEQDLMFGSRLRAMAANNTQPANQTQTTSGGRSNSANGDHHHGYRGQAIREDVRIADHKTKDSEVRRHIERENRATAQESHGAGQSRDLAVMRATRGQAPKGTSNSSLSQNATTNLDPSSLGEVAYQVATTPLSAENVTEQMSKLEDAAKSTHDGWGLFKKFIAGNKENEAKVEENMKAVRAQYERMQKLGLTNNPAEMQKLLNLMLVAADTIDTTKAVQDGHAASTSKLTTMIAGGVMVGAVAIAGAPIVTVAAVAVGVGILARAGVKYAMKGRDEDRELLGDVGQSALDGGLVLAGGFIGRAVSGWMAPVTNFITSKIPAGASAATNLASQFAQGAVRGAAVGAPTGAIVGGGRAAVESAINPEIRSSGAGHIAGHIAHGTAEGAVVGGVAGAVIGGIDNSVGERIRGALGGAWAKLTGAAKLGVPAKASAQATDAEPTSTAKPEQPISRTASQTPKVKAAEVPADDAGVNLSPAEKAAADRLLRQALGEPTPSAAPRVNAHDDAGVRLSQAEKAAADKLLEQALSKPAQGISEDVNVRLSPSERAAADRLLQRLQEPSSNGNSNVAPASPKPVAKKADDGLDDFVRWAQETANAPRSNTNQSPEPPQSGGATKPTSQSKPTPTNDGPSLRTSDQPTATPQTATKPAGGKGTALMDPPEEGLGTDTKSLVDELMGFAKPPAANQQTTTPAAKGPGLGTKSASELADELAQSGLAPSKPEPVVKPEVSAKKPQVRANDSEGGSGSSGLPKEDLGPKLSHAKEPTTEAPGQPKLQEAPKPAPQKKLALKEADADEALDQWEKDYARLDAKKFMESMGITVKEPAQRSAPATEPASTPAPKAAPAVETKTVSQPAPSREPIAEPQVSTRPIVSPVAAPTHSPLGTTWPAQAPMAAAAEAVSALSQPANKPANSPYPSPQPENASQNAAEVATRSKVREEEDRAYYFDTIPTELDESEQRKIEPTIFDEDGNKIEDRKPRRHKDRAGKFVYRAGRRVLGGGQDDVGSELRDSDCDGIPDDPTHRPYFIDPNKDS